MSKRFWISWYQPTQDYRPLTDPPHPQVLGWWRSGYREKTPILCALVEAQDESAARTCLEISWPESATAKWRFADEVPRDWMPSDRFVIDKPWMRERLGLK